MSSQIIEVAIRSPKPDVSREEFVAAKDAAVQKLVSLKDIGPEREFQPFETTPQPDSEVFVGMTRYATKWRTYGAMMNFGFMIRLMGLMKRMEMRAGVLLSPDDDDFSYTDFATAGNAVEIALLKPHDGVTQEAFATARRAYLGALEQQDGVLRTATFSVAGGFKLTDTQVHFVVYRDRAAHGAVASQVDALPETSAFRATHDAALVTVTETIK